MHAYIEEEYTVHIIMIYITLCVQCTLYNQHRKLKLSVTQLGTYSYPYIWDNLYYRTKYMYIFMSVCGSIRIFSINKLM